RSGVGPALDRVPAGARCLVTIDCDGLDTTVMPGVSARAPGGLLYPHVLELLYGIAAKATIVGFDLVELMPERDPSGLSTLTAARIVCNELAAMAISRGGSARGRRRAGDFARFSGRTERCHRPTGGLPMIIPLTLAD